ncbi:hypothetical protein [Actinoplanes sp. NPDC026619]|uniref:hypothetical protein n=1 Tax=Actinoplanes sp. NPDC026619 TaxID=3155798 RepID=UPI0033FD722B
MLAIIVAYVSVWIVADNEIAPDVRPVTAGSVLQVGPAVSFVPQDGWYIDVTDSSSDGSTASTTLAGGGATFLIRVSPWAGTLAQEVSRQKKTSDAFTEARFLSDDATFDASGGLRGVTFSFVNQGNQGRMWISVDQQTGRAVLVVGRALSSSFTSALPDFQDMVDSIRTEQA